MRLGATWVAVTAGGKVGNRMLAVEDAHRKGALRAAASRRNATWSLDVVEVV